MLLLKVKNPQQKQVQTEPGTQALTEGRMLQSEKFQSDIHKLLEKGTWNSQPMCLCHFLAQAPQFSRICFFSS